MVAIPLPLKGRSYMKGYLKELESWVARMILARVAVRLREELAGAFGKTPEALPSADLPRLTWSDGE
jgi:hypothetical protein